MPNKSSYERSKQRALETSKNAPKEKVCTKCKELKNLELFSNLCVGKYGKHPQCKQCVQAYSTALYFSNDDYRKDRIEDASRRNRKTKYGITNDNFLELLASQNNCCAICNIYLDGSRFSLIGQLDHCHITKNIRGVLCGKCNTALGLFKDNPENLLSAIQYLERTTNG